MYFSGVSDLFNYFLGPSRPGVYALWVCIGGKPWATYLTTRTTETRILFFLYSSRKFVSVALFFPVVPRASATKILDLLSGLCEPFLAISTCSKLTPSFFSTPMPLEPLNTSQGSSAIIFSSPLLFFHFNDALTWTESVLKLTRTEPTKIVEIKKHESKCK